jgi:hypothetical protein
MESLSITSSKATESLYQPLNIDKHEFRILDLIQKPDDATSSPRDSETSLIKLKMKTVSLDDFTPKSRKLMENNDSDIFKRSLMKQDAELEDPITWKSSEEKEKWWNDRLSKAEGMMNKEDFGRWEWGDYCTLSYMWGDPTDPKKISVNGHVVEVTRNLWDFLHELVMENQEDDGGEDEGDRVWLWIDALCINQHDVDEKSTHVKWMKDIYAQSLACITWLGPASEDSDKAMDFLTKLSMQQINNTAEGIAYMARLREDDAFLGTGIWKAFMGLVCRPYWSRLWVIQEITLSESSLNIKCGRKYINWRLLCAAIDILSCDMDCVAMGFESDLDISDDEDEEGDKSAEPKLLQKCYDQFNRLQQLAIFSASFEKGAGIPSLSAILPISREAKQTDERDKVYGILSLLDPEIRNLIEPAYNLTPEEIYTDFAKAVITGTGSLDILCQNRYIGEKSRKLPSWVPDWRDSAGIVGQELTVGVPYQTSKDRKGIVSFEGDTLTVQGFIFDQVDGLGGAEDEFDNPVYPVFQSKHNQNAYESEAATREALWRTFVSSRTGQGDPAPESWAGVLDIPWNAEKESELELWGYSEFRERTKSLLIAGREFQSFFPLHGDLHIDLIKDWVGIASIRLGNVAMGRRLITTEKGYIGMAINKARQGDLLVVALGATVPFVLRPNEQDGTYAFVGETYIHGIMEGEAINALEAGQYSLKDFVIV